MVEVETMVFEKKKTSFLIALHFLLTAFVGMQTSVVAAGEPPIPEAGGPYIGEECYPMLLDASGSYDLEGDLLTYRWCIDGVWIENGNYPYIEWTWNDEFSGELILEVSDGSTIVSDTASVSIVNVPPVILAFDAPSEVDEDTEFLVQVNFFDGLPDPRSQTPSSDSFMVTFSWDDGTSDDLFLGSGEFSAGMSHVYEEAGIYQVMIILADSDGGEARAEWTVVVGEVASVDAGPDVIIDEGSMFVSSGFLGDSDSVTYTAFVDYYDDSGAIPLELYPGNAFDLRHQYLEDGIYNVLVMVFNDGMEYGEDTVEVTVNNIDPSFESLSLSPSDAVQPNTAVQVTGSFSDPGILDAHTITFDWGDGSSIATDLDGGVFVLSGSHSYSKAGNYTVLVTILDDDGGMCSRSMLVVVKAPPAPSSPPSTDSIKRYIAGLKIPLGLKFSLVSALDIVPHLLKHHMIRAAMNQLHAFIHFVDAQSGKRLTQEQAHTLMNAARSIIQSLNVR